MDGSTAWTQAEPIDLRCSPSHVTGSEGSPRNVHPEPLDLRTSPRPQPLNMDAYYMYPTSQAQYHPTADTDQLKCRIWTENHSSYDRQLPFNNWDYASHEKNWSVYGSMVNSGSDKYSRRSSYSKHYSHKYNPYPQPIVIDQDPYMDRPSCLFSQRDQTSGVTHRRTEPVGRITSGQSGHAGQDLERNVILTKGGSCKYVQKTSTPTSREVIDNNYHNTLSIPAYNSYHRNKLTDKKKNDIKGKNAMKESQKHTQVFVSNTKHCTGGFVITNMVNDLNKIDVLPAISIPDFTFSGHLDHMKKVKQEDGCDLMHSTDRSKVPHDTRSSTRTSLLAKDNIKQELVDVDFKSIV